MTLKKKIFIVLALIIISAIIVVIFVSFVNGGGKDVYDGTLVKIDIDFPRLL